MSRRRNARAARLAERSGGAGAGPSDAIWPGIPGGLYRPLSDDQIQQMHATVLSILSEVGLRGATQTCIDTVVAAGGKFTDEGRLLMPVKLIEDTLAFAGRGFKLHAQDPQQDLEPWPTRIHLGTSGAAVSIVDSRCLSVVLL